MKGLAIIATVVGSSQVGSILQEGIERHQKYASARQYTDNVGKPLLVVGGPNTVGHRLGWMIPHGFGDVCLDISETACRGAPEQVVADVREIPYPDKYFGAAFCGHILEHLPTIEECEKALDELERVSDKIFIAGPHKLSIKAWLVRDHHLWVNQEGDTVVMEQR